MKGDYIEPKDLCSSCMRRWTCPFRATSPSKECYECTHYSRWNPFCFDWHLVCKYVRERGDGKSDR